MAENSDPCTHGLTIGLMCAECGAAAPETLVNPDWNTSWPPPGELAANGVDQSIQLPSVLPDAAEIERWAGVNLTPAQASARFYAAADALRAAQEAERAKVRGLVAVVTDSDLIEHWAECPAPPDAGCDECKRWFAARFALDAALAGDGL